VERLRTLCVFVGAVFVGAVFVEVVERGVRRVWPWCVLVRRPGTMSNRAHGNRYSVRESYGA